MKRSSGKKSGIHSTDDAAEKVTADMTYKDKPVLKRPRVKVTPSDCRLRPEACGGRLAAATAFDHHVLVVLKNDFVVLINIQHGDGGKFSGDTASLRNSHWID